MSRAAAVFRSSRPSFSLRGPCRSKKRRHGAPFATVRIGTPPSLWWRSSRHGRNLDRFGVDIAALALPLLCSSAHARARPLLHQGGRIVALPGKRRSINRAPRQGSREIIQGAVSWWVSFVVWRNCRVIDRSVGQVCSQTQNHRLRNPYTRHHVSASIQRLTVLVRDIGCARRPRLLSGRLRKLSSFRASGIGYGR
jgi:hypothetical protein